MLLDELLSNITVAKYWKNGVATTISATTSLGSKATGIVVK